MCICFMICPRLNPVAAEERWHFSILAVIKWHQEVTLFADLYPYLQMGTIIPSLQGIEWNWFVTGGMDGIF